MRGDPLVNNVDDMFLANETQAKKIKYLQNEKHKSQEYIKDLQQTIHLCKQSMSSLASSDKNQAMSKVNQQNKMLVGKLQQYYQEIMNLQAELLIEQQLRVEEKKFYHERLQEFENTMSQLRKSLQDKEDSFTPIVDRLKKYQDLNEAIIKDKLYQYKQQLQANNTQQILKNLSEERDYYRKKFEQTQPEIQKLAILKACFTNKVHYQTFKKAFLNHEQMMSEEREQVQKLTYLEQKTKNTNHTMAGRPNKELIKLLKKEKLSNEILEDALNEAIQKNQELIFENNQLIEANQQNKKQVKKIKAKLNFLERYLSRYQLAYKWKSSWTNSKCDLDTPNYPFLEEINGKIDEDDLYIEHLKKDIQKITQYLYINIPTKKLKKALSEPRIGINIDEDQIEIEQI